MNDLKSTLMRDEGMRLLAYDDANGAPVVPGYTMIGHVTIGWGRCLDLNGISVEEASILIESDIKRATNGAQTFPWFYSLSPARRDVIVMMVFNLGLTRFCEFKKLIAAIAKGDFNQAASEMLSSHWSAQVGSRAVRLATLMRDGAYAD